MVNDSDHLLWPLSFMLETLFRCLVILGHLHMFKYEELKICLQTECVDREGQQWIPSKFIWNINTLVSLQPFLWGYVLDRLPRENSFSLQPEGPSLAVSVLGVWGESLGVPAVTSASPSGVISTHILTVSDGPMQSHPGFTFSRKSKCPNFWENRGVEDSLCPAHRVGLQL